MSSQTPAISTQVITGGGSAAPGYLDPFPDLDEGGFASIRPFPWKLVGTPDAAFNLPFPLEQITNRSVLDGLTSSQRSLLSQYGFVIADTQEEQFIEIRHRVSMRYGQPYYLTTDAAFHAVNTTLNEVLIALEREELHPRMVGLVRALLTEVLSYQPLAKGTLLEEDIKLAVMYLGVGLRLLDPHMGLGLEPDLDAQVAAQVTQIMEAGGMQHSILIPEIEDDFRAYRPIGHYAGDHLLESYFRGLTWFKRARFILGEPSPHFEPSRAPLVITFAIRQATTEQGPAAEEWDQLDDIFTFLSILLGEGGPRLYANLMDQVYGKGITFLGLSDDPLWRDFRSLAAVFPPLRKNTPFVDFSQNVEGVQGWRFLGGDFNFDDYVFFNLANAQTREPQNPQMLPGGLDLMAILGSSSARQILDEAYIIDDPNYASQAQFMQEVVGSHSEEQWLSSVYSTLLYAILPQLMTGTDPYPEYMRTSLWSIKSLNSALGSWVERRNDVSGDIELPVMSEGSGPPSSGPAPGYVEPQPLVFYRLSYLTGALSEGLNLRGFVGNRSGDPLSLSSLLVNLADLSDRFQSLGDIAAKELEGYPLNQDDYWLIQAPLGHLEGRVQYSKIMSARGLSEEIKMPPMTMITSIGGSTDPYLQAGLGRLGRIYVIVPLDGSWQIAQGGVYSYYEFPQIYDEPLTNLKWRRLLSIQPVPELPDWSKAIFTKDGYPVDVLAFRVGDLYRITPAGGRLIVRNAPGRQSVLIQELHPGDYVMIVDGPVQMEGFTWWKLDLAPYADTPIEGWAVENPSWYERAWGQ